jgi:SdrD B-like domain
MMQPARALQLITLFFNPHERKSLSAVCVLSLFGTSMTANVMAQATAGQPAVSTKVTGSAVGAYVDRVIDGLIPDDGLELKASEFNASGWPRSWRLDYSLFSQQSESRTELRALALSGFIDTPNYGSLSANGNFVRQQLDSSGQSSTGASSTWRLDQRGVPLGGGWRANYSAGDISTGLTALSRGVGRVALPSTPIRGLAGQWYLSETANLNFASGQTGLFSGFNTPGFQTSGGQITSVGAQAELPMMPGGGRVDAALQLIDGRKISYGGSSLDTQSMWLAAAWEGTSPWADAPVKAGAFPAERSGGLRVQANLVKSISEQVGSVTGPAVGFWTDASWRTERWRNTAGVFRFDPNLRWGSSVLASDLKGAYWQADTSTRQWQAGFSTELTDSVSHSNDAAGLSSSSKSAFLNLNGRYRLDSRNGLGASLNLRAIRSPGQSLQLSWNQQNDWGQTQWRGELSKIGDQRTSRVGFDHSWVINAPVSLNTSLAVARMVGGNMPGNGLTWGLLGTASPWSQWSLDASLRGERGSIGSGSVSANLGLNWQSFDGWSLALRYTETRGQDVQQTLVVSALTAATLPVVVTLPASRSVQLVLRYSGRAGSASAPLGGSPGGGAGSVSGSVFFDTDWNGKREASEAGVANVTVILDRRYVTRTDAQGRYEFPSVAEGTHLLEVSSDNVPLPWSPLLREPIKIRIEVRESSIQDFAVQRER